MLTTEQRNMPFAFTLEHRQALRVWEQAIRCSAVVSLTPRTDEELQLSGPIESDTGESLWISIGGAKVEGKQPLQSVCCDGLFELGDARYLFETNILAIRSEQGVTLCEIARPSGLEVIQRRRFWRCPLRESAPVLLSRPRSDDPEAQRDWACNASMMNVSVDGLACRVERADADAVAMGEVVQTVFCVPPDGHPFTIDAVVKSKIPAGTDGQLVMGLQFRHADEGEYKRLHEALERSS